MAASSGDSDHEFECSNSFDASIEPNSSVNENLRRYLIRNNGMEEIATPPDGNCLFTCLCFYVGLSANDRFIVRSAIVAWMVRYYF